jgi:hypothetical protein
MRIRQSDLSAYARCAQQKKLVDLSRQGLVAKPAQLSMTAFGSVVHYAVHVLEKLHHNGREDALEKAKATFIHYWDPENISQICEPVDIWAGRQTWHGLLKKGPEILDLYYARLQSDKGKLLGLEVEFNLPFVLDGVEHTLHGTMDRLSLRKTSSSFLNIEDYKTGQDYKNLRWNAQFSMYAWATLQPGFWDAWGDEGPDLHARFSLLPRRGTWISLRDGVKRSDAGWRGPQDYERLWAAIRGYIKAVEADIYPLSLKGDVCEYCAFREGICGGVAVPDPSHGGPA